MITQHGMLGCAPGRTDIALAANSGAYNAGIAAGAALGALVLRYAGVRGAFLAGGLLTAGACTVLLAGRRVNNRAPRRAAVPGLASVAGPAPGYLAYGATHALRAAQSSGEVDRHEHRDGCGARRRRRAPG